jgi:RHH-type rel operon transcriptional repressor/antitoxin RelB
VAKIPAGCFSLLLLGVKINNPCEKVRETAYTNDMAFFVCYTCIASYLLPMLAIRLDKKTEDRLAQLARKTGRTKTFYAREAILTHLEDMEDAFLAVQRLRANERTYSLDEVKRELGL